MRTLKIFLFSSVLMLYFCICSCNKSCDDCTKQKGIFCQALKDNNCNSASLTFYIESLYTGCGQDEANAFITQAQQECTGGQLTCPECE